MSRNKRKTKEKNTAKNILLAVIAVLIVAIIVLVLLMRGAIGDGDGQNTQNEQESGTDTEMSVPEAEVKNDTALYNLGSGVQIDALVSYAGPFAEDRSDEFVMDVLAVRVTNNGDKYIQTMDIVFPAGDGEARFSLSTLMPGDSVIVPEKNRMEYSENISLEDVQTENVVFFEEVPTLCSDRLEIMCLDGVINVTNISDADIAGDIVIYYKTEVDGIFYGGVTYRVRIEGGLNAGEIRQGSAAHFKAGSSTVVFVTCG